MDANQVGFVHELTWDEIKTMLDNAVTIKPRRQMSVQFSGGEPTLSPLLPRRRRLRPQGRLHLGPGRDQRHRVRQVEGILQGGCGSRPALRLPAVRWHRQRRQLAPQGRQRVRREAPGHPQPARGRRRHRARHDASSTASTTSRSAASSSSRSTTPRRSTSSPSSRFRSPAATKKSRTSAARRSATPCRTWRTTSRTRPASASPSATGSRSPSCPPSPTGPIWSTDRTATGASSPAAAIPTAASAWR